MGAPGAIDAVDQRLAAEARDDVDIFEIIAPNRAGSPLSEVSRTGVSAAPWGAVGSHRR